MLSLVSLTLLLLLVSEQSQSDYITAYRIPSCHQDQRKESLLGEQSEHHYSLLLVLILKILEGRLINHMRRKTLGRRKKEFLLGLSHKYMKKSPLRFGK